MIRTTLERASIPKTTLEQGKHTLDIDKSRASTPHNRDREGQHNPRTTLEEASIPRTALEEGKHTRNDA